MNVAKKSEKHPFSLFPPRRSWLDSLSLSLICASRLSGFLSSIRGLTSPLNPLQRPSPLWRLSPTRRFSPLPALPLSMNPSRRVPMRLPLAKSPVFVSFCLSVGHAAEFRYGGATLLNQNVSSRPRARSKRNFLLSLSLLFYRIFLGRILAISYHVLILRFVKSCAIHNACIKN